MHARQSDKSVGELIHLSYSGDFSLAGSVELASSALFIESLRDAYKCNGAPFLDLAFPVEGSWGSVGVRVVQRGTSLEATLLSNPTAASVACIRAQLERMLTLDVDGSGFAAVAARDNVVAALARRQPGVRPLLFPSPYEAAARAIIGQRLFIGQAAAITATCKAEYGVALKLGNRMLHAFPEPRILAKLTTLRGLAQRKIEQLRALGVAAANGKLNSVFLRMHGRAEILEMLQRLPGVGPFSAELILLRGVGDADAFPLQEKRLHRAIASFYKLGDEPSLATLEAVADNWRPYRSWAGLLLRNAVRE